MVVRIKRKFPLSRLLSVNGSFCCGKSDRLAKVIFLDLPLLHLISFFSSSFCTFFSSVFAGGRPGFFFSLVGVLRLFFLGVVISFRGEQLSVCRPSPFKTSEYTAIANI